MNYINMLGFSVDCPKVSRHLLENAHFPFPRITPCRSHWTHSDFPVRVRKSTIWQEFIFIERRYVDNPFKQPCQVINLHHSGSPPVKTLVSPVVGSVRNYEHPHRLMHQKGCHLTMLRPCIASLQQGAQDAVIFAYSLFPSLFTKSTLSGLLSQAGIEFLIGQKFNDG